MEADLKSRMLKLLKEDEEFRYAVAGLIGLGEVLEELRELRRRSEEHDRKFNEILKRLDGHGRRLEEHNEKFSKILERLEEHDKKFNDVIMELRELRRDFSEIRSYIERTSLTLEEEAREVIEYRLEKMDIHVKLESLIKPEFEINIYGATEDLCVIGEASTRTGVRIVNLLNEKIEKLRRNYPEYLRPKIIKAIYTLWATNEAIEKARQENVWIVKATGELTPLKMVNA